MELKDWEKKALEELREKKLGTFGLYFETLSKEARKELLLKLQNEYEDKERLEIIEKLYAHRYTPLKNEPTDIDHFIRGWLDLSFIADKARGIFSKKKIPSEIEKILDDLGYNIIKEYGKAGEDIWFYELCNGVRFYISLCRKDKGYRSVALKLGKINKEKLEFKIAQDLVTTSYYNPKAVGYEESFKRLSEAAETVFTEEDERNIELYAQLKKEADTMLK